MPPALWRYDWIMGIISIAFIFSSFGNGANDVANSYATSVAARTLTMPQVGVLSMITEFIGAVALGNRVTGTIRSDIIDLNRYVDRPATLMSAMTAAEIGSATWLMIATGSGLPVSTTQTIVGALVGAGIASQSQVQWSFNDGGVSRVAASWAVAPLLAACFAALLYASVKYMILERKNSFQVAMKVIPFYLSFTGAVLALFIVVEAPTVDSLEELGAGTACGIIFGVFAGCLLLSYVFFVPYFHRRLVMKDARVRAWHIPLGPLLYKESTGLYWPGNPNDEYVIDYYFDPHQAAAGQGAARPLAEVPSDEKRPSNNTNGDSSPDIPAQQVEAGGPTDHNATGAQVTDSDGALIHDHSKAHYQLKPEPEERFLAPTAHLPIYHPQRLWSWVKFLLLQGVTRDCVSHDDPHVQKVHARVKQYDNRVEHLWTYAQVASAMMMSIAHGSNDVANAVAPWVSTYAVFQSGIVEEEVSTPIWILVIAGFLLGAGFWFYGFHIIRALGNKLTKMSPTRGFAVELGAAITVLIASRLGLPVSTTQCLTGAVMGVALMNFDFGALNWRQLAFIFMGWVITLPAAGLIAGLLMVMSLNAPQF